MGTHDVGVKWQDDSNPFGNWSVWYTEPANNYRLVSKVESAIRASAPWTTPQKSYGDLPGYFKSNGTEDFLPHDWLPGDVIVHSDFPQPVALVWTVSQASRYMVTVGGWAARDIGRVSHGILVIEDEFDVNIFGIDPITFGPNRAQASSYSHTTAAALAPGAQIIFGIRSDTFAGDYHGLNFVVRAFPEPSTADLFLVAALGLVAVRARKGIARR